MATPNIVPQADQEGGLGTSSKSWGNLFIEHPATGADNAAATISNLDTNQIALDINASNIDANVLDITGTALTTGSLATFVGQATPADGSSNNLVDFTGTFAGTGTSTFKGAFLNVDKSGITASTKSANLYGMHIDLDDSATNVGSVFAYGLAVESTFASTGGTVNNYGIYVSATGGDNNYDLFLGRGNVLSALDFTLTYGEANIGAVLGRRKFNKSSTVDGNHDGDVVYLGGTTSMTIGAIYHYKSDGTWELADADAASTSDGLLAVALGEDSDVTGMLLRGMVTLDHDPGAVGDVLYLSTTGGDASSTAPSGTGDVVRIIGYCLDASNGQIWFNPDSTFVEIS